MKCFTKLFLLHRSWNFFGELWKSRLCKEGRIRALWWRWLPLIEFWEIGRRLAFTSWIQNLWSKLLTKVLTCDQILGYDDLILFFLVVVIFVVVVFIVMILVLVVLFVVIIVIIKEVRIYMDFANLRIIRLSEYLISFQS